MFIEFSHLHKQFLSCQAGEIFDTISRNQRSESGRWRFSRQLLSLVKTCSRTINQSGEQKGLFMTTKTSLMGNSVNRSQVRLAFVLIPLACFALSPQAGGTCQEGCLTNNNTVLGDDAL